MKNPDDIIKSLLNSNGIDKNKISSMSDEDIRRIIQNTDKNKAMSKMRSMGLGALADKIGAMSDKDIAELLRKNPSVMKNLGKFLK